MPVMEQIQAEVEQHPLVLFMKGTPQYPMCGFSSRAVHAARAQQPKLPLVVEVEDLQQLQEALAAGCERILIDDFSAAMRRDAVRITAGRIPLEVSGSVDMTTLRAIAEDGVDCISIGGLTKHVQAIDLSLKLGPPPG